MRLGLSLALNRLGGGGPALWTPEQLSTLQLWLDAADTSPTNIVQSGGDVSQWSDKSGLGRHATRGTVSQQPTTGVLTIGGLNALDFTDLNHYMNVPPSVWTSSKTIVYTIGLTGAGRSTCFFRGIDGVGVAAYPLVDQSASGTPFFDSLENAGFVNLRVDGSTTNLARVRSVYDAAMADGVVHMMRMFDIPQNASITSISRPISTESWEGPIGEIVVVPDTTSTADTDKIEGSLAWKWDGGVAGTLVGALPSGHPYKSAAPLV